MPPGTGAERDAEKASPDVIRRTTKYTLEALGVVLAAGMLLIGVTVWQLSTGPISLNFLTETLETLANERLETGQLDIGETILDWSDDRTELLIYFRNVVVKDGSGEELVAVPRAFVDLRLRSLLLGEFAPQKIGLFGVSAKVVRRPDTGVEIALVSQTEEGDERTGPELGPLLAGLADEAAPGSPFRYLQRMVIRRAEVTFVDQVNNVTWQAPSATFAALRDEEGVSANFDSDILIGDLRAHMTLTGLVKPKAEHANLDLAISGFNPAVLGRSSPMFSDFAPFDLVFEGTGLVDISLKDGALLSARVELTSEPGEMNVPELSPEPIAIEQARLDVALDPIAETLIIHELDYKAGANRAQVTGRADFKRDGPFSVTSAKVDLTARNLSAAVPEVIDGELNLASVHVAGDLFFTERRAKFSDLTLRTETGFVSFEGEVKDAPETPDSPAVHATAKVENITVADLRHLWPIGLAKGARKWFFENVEGGTVTSGDFTAALEPGMIAIADNHGELPLDALDFRFTLQDISMSYLGPMPRLAVPEAKGHLTGDTFEALVPQGTIEVAGETLNVTEGRFYAPALHIKGGPGEIYFAVDGTLKGLLNYFDHEPLGFISGFGLDPDSAGGTGSLKGEIKLPLRDGIMLEEVKYKGTAKAQNASLPAIIDNISISEGMLDIAVNPEALTIEGPVKLNGAQVRAAWRERISKSAPGPATRIRLQGALEGADRRALGISLDDYVVGPASVDAVFTGDGQDIQGGPVKLDLTDTIIKIGSIGWWKPAGSPANGSFDLAFKKGGGFALNDIALGGAELEAAGKVDITAEGKVASAEISAFRLGERTRGTLSAKRDAASGKTTMMIRGPSLDARGILDELFGGGVKGMPESDYEPEEDEPAEPLEIDAAFQKAHAYHGEEVENAVFFLRQEKERVEELQLTATWKDGPPILAMIARDEAGVRRLTASTDDAGRAFKAIDFYESIEGGTVAVNGHFENEETNPVLKGTLTGANLRVIDAPLLAKLLTVGSFTGIADTMGGEGIRFEQMKVPFRSTETRLYIDEANMVGPAIGLTLRGEIDQRSDVMELAGTIVPAYTINSILGNVPILGDLFVGREGEGIFAATYAIKGKAEDPQIIVNPLAALAPGFLRRVFEFGSTLPEETDAEAPEAAPEKAPEKAGEPAEAPLEEMPGPDEGRAPAP